MVTLRDAQGNPLPKDDPIHPNHYKSGDGSGRQVIDVVEEFGFAENGHRMTALIYLMRAGKKVPTTDGIIGDLKKSIWYIEREILYLQRHKLKV